MRKRQNALSEDGRVIAPQDAGPSARTALIVAAILTAAAYANSLSGAFVYDDQTQIVQNPLIQDGRYFWKAMTSDVWAFKGERPDAWSNYWRPGFILWLMLNYRLFGLSPTGWHVTSILAHFVVTVLVYRTAVALNLRRVVCAMIAWMFAVHPVHVESVSWISGSTDVLMAGFMLGSFLFYLRPGRRAAFASFALYAAALLCKEGAIVFPAIVFLSCWAGDRSKSAGFPSAFRAAAPYAAIAVLFFILRLLVLGSVQTAAADAPGWDSLLASLPLLLMFYLRQAFVPLLLAPASPLRAVNNANSGVWNVVVPIIVAAIALSIGQFLWRRAAAYRHGVIWFVLPLCMAFYIRVFFPEHIVQNRYLYLSVFGAAIIVSNLVVEVIERISAISPSARLRTALAIGAVMSMCLAFETIRYNPVWGDETLLYERAVAVAPNSVSWYTQLGDAYRKAKRFAEAKAAFEKAAAISPVFPLPQFGLAVIANQEFRFDEAERLLQGLLKKHPDYADALDQLAISYQGRGRIDEAIAVFDRGRTSFPYNRGVYTMNIAVLDYTAGRKTAALGELESIRDLLNPPPMDLVKVWFLLGELYSELNRPGDAARAYAAFLQHTEGETAKEIVGFRQQARQSLATLPAPLQGR